LIGVLCLINGCGGGTTFNEDQLIEVTSENADNYTDVFLSVVDSKLNSDGEYEIIAAGKYDGKIAALSIKIPDKLSGATPEGVTFHTIGDESDNLIASLGELYSYPTDESFSDEDVRFDIVPLSDEEAELKTGEYRFKLFYDPNDDDGLYSELYLNINLPSKRVILSEKDEAYRAHIIKALTGN
jgi:hypothetical protein